jgi:hypothetical protein
MFRQALVVTGCGWAGVSGVLAGVWSGLAEEAGERGDGFVEQGGDACLLAGSAVGAELGGRAAVVGLGGELAEPGGHGRVDGGRAAWAGAVSRG